MKDVFKQEQLLLSRNNPLLLHRKVSSKKTFFIISINFLFEESREEKLRWLIQIMKIIQAGG